MDGKPPGMLWLALISLAVMVLLKVLASLSMGSSILVDAALCVLLLFGLYKGYRWAYVLTIIACLVGVAMAFHSSFRSGYATLVLDALVLVPVILCTEYFFPRKTRASRSPDPFEERYGQRG